MTTAKRLPLDTFLEQIDTQGDLGAIVAEITGVTERLTQHLSDHPDLAAQVQQLAETVAEAKTATPEGRPAKQRQAQSIVDDLAEKWIAAENPPLVTEIDQHLNGLRASIARLTQSDPGTLRKAAIEIDRLSQSVRHLEHIDGRYIPWALGASVLFVIGIGLTFNPSILSTWPFNHLAWTIPACLGALPLVAVHFALKVMPRSRADTQIDALNRQHFLAHGGLYFPAGAHAACVVLVDLAGHAPPDQSFDPRREIRRRWIPW